MDDPLILIGFRYSVYTRIARMALIEMGLDAEYVEANPFTPEPDPILAEHTPFHRVPVLRHGNFTLTETATITRYLNTLGSVPGFIPADAKPLARMMQVVGIIDAYGYHSLVRQVFSHGFYRPYFGEAFEQDQITLGLEASEPVMSALEAIAFEGKQLNGISISLADIHLAPMIAYFSKVPEGAEMLGKYPALSRWWNILAKRPSVIATDPFA